MTKRTNALEQMNKWIDAAPRLIQKKNPQQQKDELLERLKENEAERKYIEECLRELINRHNLNKDKS